MRNVKNCLSSDFKKVIVVESDEAAMEKVGRQLAKARLMIPSRVEIGLRDGLRRAA